MINIDTFVFNGREYPIKSVVQLNNKGRSELHTNLKCVQITSHSFDPESETHYWYYDTEWENNNQILLPKIKRWSILTPDDLIESVAMVAPLPGVISQIQDKKVASYWHKDILLEFIKCGALMVAALILKGWFNKWLACVVVFWWHYCKIEKMHKNYITESFDTFESRYCITPELVFTLYFNTENIYVNK